MTQSLSVYEVILGENGDVALTMNASCFETESTAVLGLDLNKVDGSLTLTSPKGVSLRLEQFPQDFYDHVLSGQELIVAYQGKNGRWRAQIAKVGSPEIGSPAT